MEATSKTTVKKDVKPNLNYLRDKDREMVKGIFRFHEVPNGVMAFSILIHKGDQVKNYTFKDGEICTVPLGVAKHLNKNCWYPEYGHVKSEDMQNVAQVTKKIRRCSFQSLEFVDIDELNSDTQAVVSVGAGI